MDVEFETSKLEKLCCEEAKLKKKFGANVAKRVASRLDDLEAVENLDVCRNLPGRYHELSGDLQGHIAATLPDGVRLIFRPTDNPPPTKDDGGLDWQAVTSITIAAIENYH